MILTLSCACSRSLDKFTSDKTSEMFHTHNNITLLTLNQGRIQDIQIEGAQKMVCKQRTSRRQARSPFRAGSRALEASGF